MTVAALCCFSALISFCIFSSGELPALLTAGPGLFFFSIYKLDLKKKKKKKKDCLIQIAPYDPHKGETQLLHFNAAIVARKMMMN